MKIKKIILLTFSVLLVLTFASCKSDSVTIFSDGSTEYKFITAEGAPSEAQELAKELASLSGANPEILTDASAESALEILIGDTNRAATSALTSNLYADQSVSYMKFLVAESDGKVVILADNKIGYIYALDHIKATYINNGSLSIPEGLCDIQQVSWDHYYSSELYYNNLLAEADQNRFETLEDRLNSELGRYEDSNGGGITTVGEAISGYQKLLASFDTSYFGEYSADTFKSKNIFDDPTVYPDESHPRILFRESDIPERKAALLSEQSAAQYKIYMALSSVACDGNFEPLSGSKKQNYDYSIVAKIEAKAYRYIMERDTEKYPDRTTDPAAMFGYEAIYAMKNAILTIDVPHSVGDGARAITQIMWVTSCVYDWCYDLLTEEDKVQLVAGGVNKLGMFLEIVSYDGAGTNKVPSSQDPVSNHGAEWQIPGGYFPFAIACYDEAPEIYDYVGGRFLNNFADFQNYLAQSGYHWQGSYYSAYREPAFVFANLLVAGMKDEEVELPFTGREEMAITQTYHYRPDGYLIMVGDVGQDQGRGVHFHYDSTWMFLTGNLYKNEYLKSYAYKFSNGFSSFYDRDDNNSVYKGNGGVSAVQFLAINDPEVDYVYEGTVPLTHTTKFPYSAIFANSAHNDPNAYQLYINMKDMYLTSHNHLDIGDFQIYYNGGILASNSGAYLPWGSKHHLGYYAQTVAQNSILVYNPANATLSNPNRLNAIYSGGQSFLEMSHTFDSLEEYLDYAKTNNRYYQCISLGKANVETVIDGEQVYLYSYIGGDMTNAYEQNTVDDVTRYMFSVATGDEKCPYVFITFDRITSDDASFKKTALIHSINEPILTDDGYAIITNNGGRLVVQNVGFDNVYTLVGGEGNEFNVNGTNIPHNRPAYGDRAEYGWGRIEISPSDDAVALTNHILTVMYVTDSENEVTVKAENIASDKLAGAEILGKAVLFPKDKGENGLLGESASFTLTASGECFIAGVEAGEWTITGGSETISVTVEEGTNLVKFTAPEAGTYTIAKK